MTEISTTHCDNLDEFWNCISPIGEFFNSSGTNYIYRGQSNHKWRLLPKVFRGDFLKQYKTQTWSALNDHPGQVFFEWSLLIDFIHYCDFMGLAIPNDSLEFRNYFDRQRIMSKYKHGVETSKWPEDNVVQLMALAQHHGVATRLLDFTRNPYIAAYFAAASAILAVNEKLTQETKLAIYALDINKIKSYKGLKHVTVPGSTSPNLSAQQGSFILVENHGFRGESFPLEESIESKFQSDDTSILKCITLPRFLAGELLTRCGKFGISAASIFPGYDGAAKATLESKLAFNYRNTMAT